MLARVTSVGPVLCLIGACMGGALISSCSPSQSDDTPVTAKNICVFSGADHARLRLHFNTLLPGSTVDAAEAELSNFGFSELENHPLTEQLFYTYVECPVDHGNINMWYIEIHAITLEEILDADVYLFYEGDNFTRRGVKMVRENFRGETSLETALAETSKKHKGDWEHLMTELIEGGFVIRHVPEPKSYVVRADAGFSISHRVTGWKEGAQAIVIVNDEGIIQEIKP